MLRWIGSRDGRLLTSKVNIRTEQLVQIGFEDQMIDVVVPVVSYLTQSDIFNQGASITVSSNCVFQIGGGRTVSAWVSNNSENPGGD